MSDAMSDAVTVTICGAPSRDTLSALLDVAVSAGLGFILQPRAVAQAPLLLPPAPIEVESRQVKPPRPKAGKTLKPRPSALRSPAAQSAALLDIPAALLLALKDGPLKFPEIESRFGVSRFRLRRFVEAGAVVATGVTQSRRFALPAGSKASAAKEVP